MIALWLIFSVEGANDYHFFYLLFLPVSWIAMRTGFAGAAAGVCLVHLLLLASISWGDYPASAFMGYQLLVLALAFNGLLLGAVVDERRRSDELLREQHAEVARMAKEAAPTFHRVLPEGSRGSRRPTAKRPPFRTLRTPPGSQMRQRPRRDRALRCPSVGRYIGPIMTIPRRPDQRRAQPHLAVRRDVPTLLAARVNQVDGRQVAVVAVVLLQRG